MPSENDFQGLSLQGFVTLHRVFTPAGEPTPCNHAEQGKQHHLGGAWALRRPAVVALTVSASVSYGGPRTAAGVGTEKCSM
jgi:hypothetical protein